MKCGCFWGKQFYSQISLWSLPQKHIQYILRNMLVSEYVRAFDNWNTTVQLYGSIIFRSKCSVRCICYVEFNDIIPFWIRFYGIIIMQSFPGTPYISIYFNIWLRLLNIFLFHDENSLEMKMEFFYYFLRTSYNHC